jgi:putative flippase GtrA
MIKRSVSWCIDTSKRWRHFIFYSVIGASGALLDFLVFKILTAAGVPWLPANAISVTSGITNNFVLNAWLNFRVSDRLWRRFCWFYGVGMLGLLLSTVVITVAVEVLGSSVDIAKAASMVFVVITQYGLNRRGAFR